MKRIVSLILAFVCLIINIFPIYSAASAVNDEMKEKLVQYAKDGYPRQLAYSRTYAYMVLTEELRTNTSSLRKLELANILHDCGERPDRKKYMEVLVNVMATYEFDNAVDFSEQNKLDNLKTAKDYAMDIVKIGNNAVSIMTAGNPAASKWEDGISVAIDAVSVLADNTNNWIDALSDLQTVVQDYSAHDRFLELIEENASGELKEAAKTLRKNMSSAMGIYLDTYSDVADKNFDNYTEFFFSGAFFTTLKYTTEYSSDEAFKFFVDSGDKVIEKAGIVKSTWELMTGVSKLVGNVTVGGEDLINRIFEMDALYDISQILQPEILAMNYENIDTYIEFSQYLIGCRIRGEYCVYSVSVNDAGLYAWFVKNFDKGNEEEWKDWYQNQSEKLLKIQKALEDIKQAPIPQPTEQEIEDAYLEALDFYFMAYYGGPSTDYNDTAIPAGEKWEYGRVTDPTLQTMADLRAQTRKYFTESLTNKTIEAYASQSRERSDGYAEIDGKLYYFNAGVGSVFDHATVSAQQIDDKNYTVFVHGYYGASDNGIFDYEETGSCNYCYENGEWRFSTFYFAP